MIIKVAVQLINTKLISALVSSSSENEGRYSIYFSLFNYLNKLAYSEFSLKVKILLLSLS